MIKGCLQYRTLSNDEVSPEIPEAFIYVGMIRFMLKRLAYRFQLLKHPLSLSVTRSRVCKAASFIYQGLVQDLS